MPRSPRKRTPTEIELAVLDRSRRRCTLCFHLHSDTREKLGQIAHLDQDRSNSTEDNLAFMCLKHHSLYDSRRASTRTNNAGGESCPTAALWAYRNRRSSSDRYADPIECIRADQRTLQDILNLMKEAPVQFLQFHAFAAERFSWSKVEGLVTIVIQRREPQHEFIDMDLEKLRHNFIESAAYLLSMLQITMFRIPDTPDFYSVMPHERERLPQIYLGTVKNSGKTSGRDVRGLPSIDPGGAQTACLIRGKPSLS